MNPHLQQILHEITVRLTKLEENLAHPKNDCARSHPHEEMNKECDLRTEIARLRNQLAQRTWVGLTPNEIRGISLASGESLFSAIMFTHDKLKEKNT